MTNHPSLAPLTNGALATYRVVTCRAPDHTIELMPCFVRMPHGRRAADNVAEGGLAAPIDLETGQISAAAVRKCGRLCIAEADRHPDSGAMISGFQLPLWKEAIALAKQAHTLFPHNYFVGWDIAACQDGVVLVEMNSSFDNDATIVICRTTLADTQFIPYFNHHFRRLKQGPQIEL